MKSHLSLIDSFARIGAISFDVREHWSFLRIEGKYDKSLWTLLKQIKDSLVSVGISNSLKINLDSELVDFNDFSEYEAVECSYSKWIINFNKESLLQKRINGYYINFFLTEENCFNWLSELDPLGEESRINAFFDLKIIVHDLDKGFGGEHLYFLPNNSDVFEIGYKNHLRIPDNSSIKEHVNFITNDKISFDPNTYIIRQYNQESKLCQALLKQSNIVLMVCSVNEYFSISKVVLDGLKRTTLRLMDDGYTHEVSLNQDLKELVRWLYEDRVRTRKKLFNDRFTLEIDENKSLLVCFEMHLKQSLEQAKERYNFVILERKDAYVKELKDLLKDLRTQSDLYSQKIRNLLNNFLRDALAAIVLVSFTIFTKFSENLGLTKHDLLEKVFYGLAIYYIISLLFQSVTDWSDIIITEKELKYWKRVSKELIPEREFNKYFKDSLHSRVLSSYILYPIIGALYIGIIISCLCYPYIFKNLVIH